MLTGVTQAFATVSPLPQASTRVYRRITFASLNAMTFSLVTEAAPSRLRRVSCDAL